MRRWKKWLNHFNLIETQFEINRIEEKLYFQNILCYFLFDLISCHLYFRRKRRKFRRIRVCIIEQLLIWRWRRGSKLKCLFPKAGEHNYHQKWNLLEEVYSCSWICHEINSCLHILLQAKVSIILFSILNLIAKHMIPIFSCSGFTAITLSRWPTGYFDWLHSVKCNLSHISTREINFI